MSEQPPTIRSLVLEWHAKAVGNQEHIYDDGDLRSCADQLDALLDAWDEFLARRQQIINDDAAHEIDAWRQKLLGVPATDSA